MRAYDVIMQEGQKDLHAGSFQSAARLFGEAAASSAEPDDQAAAFQMKGITLRLLGEFEAARTCFAEALRPVDDDVFHARLVRDIGMVDLDEAVANQDPSLLTSAQGKFAKSRERLLALNQPVEAAASLGFEGRALLLQGRRAEAVRAMWLAHKTLHQNNPVYELNNLLWLARASVLHRWMLASRALYLGFSHTRRLKEYAVLLIGGDTLYKWLTR